MRLVVDKPLACAIVEERRSPFGLEPRQRQIAVFGGALDGLLGFDVLEDLVVLPRDLLVFPGNRTQTRVEHVAERGECYWHGSDPRELTEEFVVPHHPDVVVLRRGIGAVGTRWIGHKT